MPLVIFFFLCFVWGTTWIAIKVSLEGLPPLLGASVRFTLALLLLAAYILWKKVPIWIEKKDFWIVSSSAFLLYTMDYGLIYWGEQYLSAGVTSIFFATFPLFTGIWATFLFRSEKFYWNKFVGLLLALAGIAVVFLDQLLSTQFDRMVIWGITAIILGAAGGAMSGVLVKKYLGKINPVSLSFHQMLQGVIFLYLFSFFLESWKSLQITPRVVAAVCYLGAVGSALAFALYYRLMQQWSAITLSLIIYITPLVALIMDYLIFAEVIHLQAVVGMLIIFGGIAFVQYRPQRLILLRQKLLKSG